MEDLKFCFSADNTVFHLAGTICTVSALQAAVTAMVKSLRMTCVDKFPVYQYHTGHNEKTYCIEVVDKNHRGKYHKVAPVVYTAVYTALVFHDMTLERTVKQYSDIVAEKEKHCQHHQVCIVQYTGRI